MGSFNIGNITPSTGELKVGDTDVYRIYSNDTIIFGESLTFNENLGIGASDEITSIEIQSDGKVIIAGVSISNFNGTSTAAKRPIRLNIDGTLDSPYMVNRTSQSDIHNLIHTSALHPDGSVLLGAKQGSFRAFSKINSDGTADTTFNSNVGTFSESTSNVYAINTSGSVIVIGGYLLGEGNIRKYDLSGNRDTNFGDSVISFGTTSHIYSVKIQPDGKILVGGRFSTFSGNNNPDRLVRLNSNGSSDTTFNTNLGSGFNLDVNIIQLQSDGKILVGGGFTSLDATTRNRLVRLNTDGTVDTSFYTNLGDGFNNTIHAIQVQSDGKILVGGEFTELDNNDRNRLVRLNSDGTEDTSFYTNLGTGINNAVNDISIQSDGKIIVVGEFTNSINGTTLRRLIRLESNGTKEI